MIFTRMFYHCDIVRIYHFFTIYIDKTGPLEWYPITVLNGCR